MRIRTLAVAVVVAAAFATPSFAQNPVGVWKVNIAKSKYSPGPAPNSSTVTTTAVAGGGFRSINETVPITGNVNADTQAYTRVDDRHYTITAKKAGKPTLTTKIEIAADGKSRTSTQTGTDAHGRTVKNFIWYDKQ